MERSPTTGSHRRTSTRPANRRKPTAVSGRRIWRLTRRRSTQLRGLNHAYTYLRKQRFPLPFLAEGIAEAIACGDAISFPIEEVSWERAVVAAPPSQDPYGEGGAFVRYLIRTYGIAAFLRYYDQAPEERDPALFAANFQSFWGTTMDDAWASCLEGAQSSDRSKICPCSLPPIDTTRAVANDPARAPYWPLPETAGQTLALSAKGDQEIFIQDCAGVRPQQLWSESCSSCGSTEARRATSSRPWRRRRSTPTSRTPARTPHRFRSRFWTLRSRFRRRCSAASRSASPALRAARRPST